MAAKNKKAKEETTRLKRELQDLRIRFGAQKEDLEVDYQKQVDDMFFYGYQCCMKKHGIANDTPSCPSYDEENEFSGGPAQGDGSATGDRHALRGGPSIEGNFHGELITTQKVLFYTFNALCFKHFCVVVIHLQSNWHVKDLAKIGRAHV